MPSLVATHNVSMGHRVGILKCGIYRLKVSGKILLLFLFVVRFHATLSKSKHLCDALDS